MIRFHTALRGAVATFALCLAYACIGTTEPDNPTVDRTPGDVPASGQLAIWTDNTNPIAVSVDGNAVGSTTARFSSTPVCGASGTVTVSLPVGSHIVSGISGASTWTATAVVTAGQCTLHKLAATIQPTTGQLSIWTDYINPINLSLDGSPVGSLTTNFASTPTCGQTGTLTVSTTPGAHIIAGVSGSQSWNGSATVVAGQCTLFKLNAPTGGGAGNVGQLSIWTNHTTQIAVKVNGNAAGTLTTYFPTGSPTCGQAGTITVTLPAGAHNVSGVAGTTTWNGSANVVAGQCSLFKLNSTTGGGGGGGSTGQLSVWTDHSTQVSVKINGSAAGTLTSYFPASTPTCGQTGTITVTLTAGTHNVSGTAGTTTWNGDANVVAGQCTLFKLNTPVGGGTGQLSIWTSYARQIAVKVNGSSVGTLTSYFPNGKPACGQSGTITISRTAGTHNVSGTASDATWNGNATVTSGQCTLYELRAP